MAITNPLGSTPPGYNRDRDPLQQQYRLARSQYDAATTQAQTLADQRQKLTAGTMPIVREGRGGSASITGYSGGAPGTSAAVAEIDKRLNAANAIRTGLIPTFNNLTNQFRQQTAGNQANAALARVGAAPLAVPALARPDFSNVRGGSRTTYGSTQPSARQHSVAAPTNRPKLNTFQFSDGRTVGVQSAKPAMPNFGIARPTLDQSQQANQKALGRTLTGQRDLTRTARADIAEIANPMSVDAELMRRLEMSQNSYFNKGSPSARKAIAEAYLGQMGARNKASLQGQDAGNAALQSAQTDEATLQRAANANATAERIAGMEDATKRTAIAAEIAKPHYDRDRQGNYMQITGTLARPVVDQDGNRIQGQLDEPAGQITPAMQYKALNEQLATLLDNPPVQAGPAYTQQVDALRQQIASLIQPRVAVNPKTGQRMQYNPRTNGWEPIP